MNVKRKSAPDSEAQEDGGFSIRKPLDREGKSGIGLFGRNELTLVFVGAAVVTILVFFFFFRSSDRGPGEVPGTDPVLEELAARVDRLETQVRELQAGPGAKTAPPPPSLDSYQARVDRVEAALSVKSDTLVRRMDGLETRLSSISKTMDQLTAVRATAPPAPPAPVKPAARTSEPQVSTTESGKDQPVAGTAAGTVHVVEKGDTLYGIARKYGISVESLRKQNAIPDSAEIHPGDRLTVSP
jgi:LysM repeat protein